MKRGLAYLLTTTMTLGLLMGVPAKGNMVEAATNSYTYGGITLSADGLSENDVKYDDVTGRISIHSNKEITLSTSTVKAFENTSYIYIGDANGKDVNLVLDNFKAQNSSGPMIEIEDNYAGNVTITLAGTATRSDKVGNAYNAIQGYQAPAIQKNGTGGGKLVITGTGELWAQNSENKNGTATGNAAIGGSDGQSSSNIQIDGGVITAISYSTGAAIGGGSGGDGNNITITGGDVKAVVYGKRDSDSLGAAIGGGGSGGDGNNITISGGVVYADAKGIGTHGGAGIGGGHCGVANNVTITSTSENPSPTVTAIGGGVSPCGSAGIGAGTEDNFGSNYIEKKNTSITIAGGVITATGSGEYGAGIGSGAKDDTNAKTTTTVTITGGTIEANGGQDAPGIGAGQYANSTTYISGGSIQAKGGSTAAATYTGDDIGFGEEQVANSGNYTKVLAYSSNDLETVSKSNPFPYPLSSKDDFNNGEIELEFTQNSSSYTYGMKDVKSTDGNLYLYLKSGVTITEKMTNGYTVTVDTPTNGVIDAPSTGKKGQNYDFTVTPDSDYKITSVWYKIGSGEYQTLSGNSGSYTIPAANVTGNITLKAEFEYKYVNVQTESVSNGTITAKAKAEKGNPFTFNVEAAPNYEIGTVQYKIGNGAYKTLEGNGSYTIPGNEITDTVTLKATFTEKAPNEYTVTVQAGSGGTVTATEVATEGEDFEFTVEPATDYKITSVRYKVQGGSDIVLSGSDNKYTIPAANVTGNITINVEFEYKYVNVQTESVSNGTITAKAKAEKGMDYPFTVGAADNYKIETVQYKIGNGDYKTLTGTDGSYTIPGSEITDTITLNATFVDSRGIPVDLSGITWDYKGPHYYKNDTYKVMISSELPEGIDTESVSYQNNEKKEIGTYTATASFVCKEGYYISKEAPSCEWRIVEYPADNITVLYNGSATELDWYNSAVSLSAKGYKLTDLEDASSFSETITMNASGSKTLYFKQDNTGYITTTGKNVDVKIDSIFPTGNITIDGNTYSSLNSEETKTCHLSETELTFSSEDANSGVKETKYAVSDKLLITSDAVKKAGLSWTSNKPSFESGKAIYVRITDKAGNITYISTPVIVDDTIAPSVVSKATSDITTTTAKCSVTLSEESNYSYLLVKDTEQTPSKESILSSGTKGTGANITKTFTNLIPNTTYKLYIVADDGRTNLSDENNANQSSAMCAITFTTDQEDVNGIVLKYNNSTTMNEWYQGSVEIRAEGYYISEKANSSFSDSCVIIKSTTTGDVTKTLYFKNVNGSAPISEGLDITVKFDNTKPTGSIGIDGEIYTSLNTTGIITRHLDETDINVTSSDEHSGEDTVYYASSEQPYTTVDAIESAGLNWKTTAPSFESGKAIYIKIVDKVGNVQYVSTPVIINDVQAPVVKGTITNETSTSADYSLNLTDTSDNILQYAYVLLDSDAQAPANWEQAVAKIDEGAIGGTGMTNGVVSGTFNNLKINTKYKLYVVAHDGMTRLDESVSNPNYSQPVVFEVNTTKAKASISNQTLSVKSGVATSYTYNLQQMLTSSSIDLSTMGTVSYSANAESGDILSGTGVLEINGSMLTIPVKASFAEEKEHYITITIHSDNYEDITTSLVVKSVSKTPVALDGVIVSNKIYNGAEQGYTDTIQWKNGEQVCNVIGTNVQYVGIKGTTYGPVDKAPIDAGEYQVTFTVDSSDPNYEGTQTYTYIIEKADLNAEMANAAWYLDGNKVDTHLASVIGNGKIYTPEYKDYSDKLQVKYSETTSATDMGNYITIASFEFVNESDANNYILPESTTLLWKVVEKEELTLGGVIVSDVIYNEKAQGYSGSIQWYKGDQMCDVDSTTVIYEGIDGTSHTVPGEVPVDAGKYRITFVVNDDEYTGTKSYEYTIQKADLDAEMVNAAWYINGEKVDSDSPSVIGNGQTYTVEYKDYSDKLEVEYRGDVSASAVRSYETTVSFAFKDTFEDAKNYNLPAVKTLYWKIVPKLTVSFAGENLNDVTYNGSPQGYNGNVQWMNEQEICEVSRTKVEYIGIYDTVYGPSESAPTDAGDYKVTFTVVDDQYEGEHSYWYTIKKADLDAEMVNAAWYINDSKVDSDSIISVIENGQTYTVEYKDYSDKLKVHYEGQSASAYGSYTTTVSFEFKESFDYEKNYNLPDKVELDWEIRERLSLFLNGVSVIDTTYNGTAQGYNGIIQWMNNGEVCDVDSTIVTYEGINGTSYDSSTLAPTNAGDYQVTFTVNDDVYIGMRSYKYTIEKANLDEEMADVAWYIDDEPAWDESISVSLTGEEYSVELKNYSDKVIPLYDGTQSASEAGNYETTVDFEFADSVYETNYRLPDSMTLHWEITDKITPDMSAVAWCYKQGDTQKAYNKDTTTLYANGQEYTVEVTGLPEGVMAEYDGTCTATEPGVYTAYVTFTNADPSQYIDPRIENMTLEWEIKEKLTYDMSKVKWVYQQNGTTADYVAGTTKLTADGSVYKVTVTGLPEGVTAEYSGTYAASVAGDYTATVTFKNANPDKYKNPTPLTMSLSWSIGLPETEEKEPTQTIVPETGSEQVNGTNKYTIKTASATGGTVEYKAPTNKNLYSVTIPATITIEGQTYQVTSIAKNAFSGCKKLSSVTIQNGIITIGANAFKGCTKLKKITIPSSVTSIGTNAFSGCKVMTKATIGKNVKTIGNGAFSGCTKLSTVSITSSAKLSKIGDKAFYKCTSLKKITLPKNVTTIGKSAFEGCKKLNTITIKSKKLKKVGSKAIKNINKKATIKCPNKSSANKYKKLFNSKTGYKKPMKVK